MTEDINDAHVNVAGQTPVRANLDPFLADRRARIQRGPLQGSEGKILDCPEEGRLLIALDGPLRGIYLKVDKSLVDLV
jgi:hypothetical protein